MKVFKIRNKSTGLFSTGGSSPHWEENGKTWKKLGFITNHLSNATGYGLARTIYDDAEIVEYEYEPIEVSTYSMQQLIEDKMKQKQKVEDDHEARMRKYKYEQALKVVNEYKE